ncbi:hypothetical protein [Streptomyces lasiicapitis]|uniref:hypothetical protein n=1 Tax=Streptomyces lasiicapitis TaxID=1923961 RepID=UPI00364D4B23
MALWARLGRDAVERKIVNRLVRARKAPRDLSVRALMVQLSWFGQRVPAIADTLGRTSGESPTVELTSGGSALEWKHQHIGSSTLSHMPFAGVLLLHDASQPSVAVDAFDTQVEEHLSQLGTPILGHFTYDPALMPVHPHYPGAGAATVLDPITTGQSAAITSAAIDLARRLWPDVAQDDLKAVVPTPST